MSEVRRTQIYLEPSLHEALRREAFATRKTISSCVRGILARHFKMAPGRKNAVTELLKLSGVVRGDKADVGRRHDEYLADALYEDLHRH